MKITICAYDAPNNIDGPTVWLKRLLPYLRLHGIEARILFMANKVKNLSNLRFFEELQFACRLIPAELFFEEQMQLIVRDLAQYPPDVFIPNYFPVAGYVSGFIKSAGIPSVMVLHNDDDLHRALVAEFAQTSRKKSLSCVVAVSRLLEKEIHQYDLSTSRSVCIPYGAPVPQHKAEWAEKQTLKMVYLGRLNNKQKRIADVTKAFCRVTKEVQNVEAVIYGSGSDLPEVLSIIARENAQDKVSYGGVVSIDKIQTRLLENHVFVLLSEFEGIPIALMEAMACGLVPVCSDIKSGISELIFDQVNGVIVTDRNNAFVKAIKDLAAHPQKWKTLSAAARNTIQGEYEENSCHDRWITLLHELASQNTYTGSLPIPALRELKKILVRKEFLEAQTRMPHPLFVPFVRMKKRAGQFKRNFL